MQTTLDKDVFYIYLCTEMVLLRSSELSFSDFPGIGQVGYFPFFPVWVGLGRAGNFPALGLSG